MAQATSYIKTIGFAEALAHSHNHLSASPPPPQQATNASRLLLKLVQDTYVTLTVWNCTRASVDTCRVDWLSTSLVREPSRQTIRSVVAASSSSSTDNSNNNNNESYDEIALSELQHDVVGQVVAPKDEALIVQQLHRQLDSRVELAKLTYLSASSLLCVCGILINLFIITILIFSTKQKRSSIIRGNNSGQKNVLLFQLTITGLLLASYVLVDNASLRATSAEASRGKQQQQQQPHETRHSQREDAAADCGAIQCSQMPTILPQLDFDVSGRGDAAAAAVAAVASYEVQRRSAPPACVTISKHNRSASNDETRKSERLAEGRQVITAIAFVDCVARANSSDYNDDDDEEEPKRAHDTNTFAAHTLVRLFVNVLASVHIWTVVSLAYDRYQAIAYPLQYLRSMHSTPRVGSFLAVVWCIALALNLFVPSALDMLPAPTHSSSAAHIDSSVIQTAFALARAAIGTLPQQQQTQSDMGDRARLRAIRATLTLTNSVASFVIFILVPLCIITICNMSIYKIVKVHERRLSISSATHTLASSHQQQQQHANCAANADATDKHHQVDASSLLARVAKQLARPRSRAAMSDSAVAVDATVAPCAAELTPARRQTSGATLAQLRRQSFVQAQRARQALYSHTTDDSDTSNSEQPGVATAKSRAQNQCVNRASRVLDRQDSYQIMANLMAARAEVHCGTQSDTTAAKSHTARARYLTPSLHQQHQQQQQQHLRRQIKRKMSDLGPTSADERASDDAMSTAAMSYRSAGAHSSSATMMSQHQHYYNHSSDYRGAAAELTQQHAYNSGSILTHLKMAGLSFAGIQLQEPLVSGLHRPLSKSSSCSLANIMHNAAAHLTGHHNNDNKATHPPAPPQTPLIMHPSPRHMQRASLSRCSFDTSMSSLFNPASVAPKKTHVYLMSSTDRGATQTAATTRTITKLSPADDGGAPDEHDLLCGVNNNNNNNGSTAGASSTTASTCGPARQSHSLVAGAPGSGGIGTKSAAFNVLIWLMVSLLLCALPHYLLVTLDRCTLRSYSHAEPQAPQAASVRLLWLAVERRNTTRASQLLQSIAFDSEATQDDEQGGSMSREHASWLSALCRTLFMVMIPLNGWLYGIRSQSLKSTVRMVLKQYISRRQASIEIDQRKRLSVMSCQSTQMQHTRESIRRCNSEDQQQESCGKQFVCRSCRRPCESMHNSNNNNQVKFSVGDHSDSDANMSSEAPAAAMRTARAPLKLARSNSFNGSCASSISSSPPPALPVPPLHLSAFVAPAQSRPPSSRLISASRRQTRVRRWRRASAASFIAHAHAHAQGPHASRRSPSEFKLLVTSAEQRVVTGWSSPAPSSSSSSSASSSSSSSSTSSSSSSSPTPSPEHNARAHVRRCSSVDALAASPLYSARGGGGGSSQKQVPGGPQWCNDLRRALAKLLIGSAARLLSTSGNMHQQQQQRSIQSEPVAKKRHSGKCSSFRYNSQLSARSDMRVSVSLAGISRASDMSSAAAAAASGSSASGGAGSQCMRASIPATASEQSEGAGARRQTPSPNHLKPPNFLKLIFDSKAPYAANAALSPIRECSSNHSYASSQSSLAALQLQQQQQQQQKQQQQASGD